MDEQWGIAKANEIPWHIPKDLRRFKKITMGHHIIMGRNTWETLQGVLPGRICVILTRNPNYQVEGGFVVKTLSEALAFAERNGETEAFVIGGGEVFQDAIQMATRLYISYIHSNSSADIFFPEFDMSLWIEVYREYHESDENNQFAHTFVLYKKDS